MHPTSGVHVRVKWDIALGGLGSSEKDVRGRDMMGEVMSRGQHCGRTWWWTSRSELCKVREREEKGEGNCIFTEKSTSHGEAITYKREKRAQPIS